MDVSARIPDLKSLAEQPVPCNSVAALAQPVLSIPAFARHVLLPFSLHPSVRQFRSEEDPKQRAHKQNGAPPQDRD